MPRVRRPDGMERTVGHLGIAMAIHVRRPFWHIEAPRPGNFLGYSQERLLLMSLLARRRGTANMRMGCFTA
jgi:hypothetical protein